MRRSRFVAVALGIGCAVLQAPISRARASDAGGWIATWTASPQPVWDADSFAPVRVPRNFWNQTVRQIASLSVGGRRVRVVLSNEYGKSPPTSRAPAARTRSARSVS